MSSTAASAAHAGAFALGAAVRAGRRDPVALVEESLARIADVDGELGAFVAVDAAGAREAAEQVRRAVAAGEPLGPLAGVPVAVKDLFDVAGAVTRGGSAVPPDPPAVRDAAAVARLRAAGAVVVGRTRTHEFAWGLTTQHPWLGGTRNPHDPTRIPGGSSGGSAAAVAAGLVPLALGTDTGCSLRLPAAFCGLVAHKPTAGLVPLDGVLPLAPSMDSAGVLVRDVADARAALALLTGRDLPEPAPCDGLRIGVVGAEGGGADASGGPPLSRAVAAVLVQVAERLADQGMGVERVRLPLLDRGVEAYRGVQAREAWGWHTGTGRWPRYADRYGDDVRARLAACGRMSEQELDAAAELREQIRAGWRSVFAQVDLVVLPVASTGPSRVTSPDTVTTDGQDGDLRAAVLPWTVPANLGGWPACAVPVGRDDDGLPIGVQVVGPAGSDARVLDVAAELARPLPVPELRRLRSSG